jgi:hypothetical protein
MESEVLFVLALERFFLFDGFAAGLFANIDDLCCSCGTYTYRTERLPRTEIIRPNSRIIPRRSTVQYLQSVLQRTQAVVHLVKEGENVADNFVE